jgi:cytochrome c biogenesis protein CcmG/thiol:disulfide interchange protein DsbE
MKKTLGIILAVAALVIGVHFADKATRVSHNVNSPGAAGTAAADSAVPDLTLKDLNGNNVSLAQYKGKVVLVNFWATWCDPCRVEIPWLIEMQEKYGPKGFTVVGIAMDDEGKSVVAPFVAKERFDVNGQKLPMNYPILVGSDNAASRFGGLLGYPTSVLISRDGKQVKRVTGIISDEDMSKTIEKLL